MRATEFIIETPADDHMLMSAARKIGNVIIDSWRDLARMGRQIPLGALGDLAPELNQQHPELAQVKLFLGQVPHNNHAVFYHNHEKQLPMIFLNRSYVLDHIRDSQESGEDRDYYEQAVMMLIVHEMRHALDYLKRSPSQRGFYTKKGRYNDRRHHPDEANSTQSELNAYATQYLYRLPTYLADITDVETAVETAVQGFNDWIYDEMDGYETFGDIDGARMQRFRQRIEKYVRHLYANKLPPA